MAATPAGATAHKISTQRSGGRDAGRAGAAVAATASRTVLAWGSNGSGELGDGTTTDSDTPVRVDLAKGTKVTGISAGANFSLARTSKGHALAWGQNHDGELGNGENADSETPVRVQLPKSRPCPEMTPLRRENSGQLTRRRRGARLRRALPRCGAPARCLRVSGVRGVA